MKISDLLNYDKPSFSLEVLPPAKGQDIKVIFENIDPIAKYNPAFISITYHRDEVVYKHLRTGAIEERTVRKRPGTVAVAAALNYRYGIPVV
ncbi:MAG TPA: methylenetetrahydrofolate reductase [NAD(P)H], partial [Bacteroidales bacterium]|nr:methylenetetrahydrofolate reductase [NAD(P)H] [Bacteroidales bacterium]